ncbi:MAG: hypothetical protein HY556_01355 [Euryarchaeota archaeon]|nr:hypothetical protein [Euryarchaeota archaeon]
MSDRRRTVHLIVYAVVLGGLVAASVFGPAEYGGLSMVGFVVGLLLFLLMGFRRESREWKEFGAAIGFAAAAPGPHVPWSQPFPLQSGSAGAHPATIWRRGGEDEAKALVFGLSPMGVDPGISLTISRENIGERLAKALGGQDIEVGNPDLDARFRVVARDESRARSFLGLASQAAITRLNHFGTLTVGRPRGSEVLGPFAQVVGGAARLPAAPTIVFERKGYDLDPVKARGDLEALAILADALVAGARR